MKGKVLKDRLFFFIDRNKHRLIVLGIMLICLANHELTVPVLAELLNTINNFIKSEAWPSYLGAIIGGLFTLAASVFAFKEERDLRRQSVT